MGALTQQQETRLADVRQAFGKRMKSFEAALPSHIKVERFSRTVLTALMVQPKLLQHPVEMILQECLRAAQDGLMPDGKEAALVPRGFGNNASVAYQPMIAGIRKKARNSGEISTWKISVIHANDHYKITEGTDPNIEHEPELINDRGEWILVYSVCRMKDGTVSFDWMNRADVFRIRDRSDAYKAFVDKKIKSTPWHTDEIEMAKKTVARRHSKELPMSSDLDRILFDGAEHEGPTIDYGDVTVVADAKKGLANQLEALGADEEDEEQHDPETGEIKDGNDQGNGGQQGGDGNQGGGKTETREERHARAKEAGRQACRDNIPKRKMPKSIREDDDDQLAASWIEGWDEADKEAAANDRED